MKDFEYTTIFFIDAENEYGQRLFWNKTKKEWEETYREDEAYCGEYDIATFQEAEAEFDIASISPKKVAESIIIRLNQATFGEKPKKIRNLKR